MIWLDLLGKKFAKSPSAKWLILLNLFPIIGVIFLNWSLAQMIVSYWAESIVIGFFNVLKMMKCGDDFSPSSIANVDPSWEPAQQQSMKKPASLFQTGAKLFYCVFFSIHYGGFLFGHFMFIMILFLGPAPEGINNSIDYGIIGTILIFIIVHGYSYINNYIKKKEYENATLKGLMFSPYKRIIVVHVFILASGFFIANTEIGSNLMYKSAVILFILLKIGVDTFSHFKERDKYAQASERFES